MTPTRHEPITVKPIAEVAQFQKNMIPANIPVTYAIKPIFKDIAQDEDIHRGVVAFRDFLCNLCDCLATEGHSFAKPAKKPSSMADYPFLYNLTNFLVDIGYHGKLSENGGLLLATNLPLCTATVDANGKKTAPKISATSQKECIQFLTLCGVNFHGTLMGIEPMEISYPSNPIMLTGLKALAIADMELRAGRRYWNDNNLLRCDYRMLKSEESDMADVLMDFLHPLPENIRKFALDLHKRYTAKGLNCINTRLGLISFAYANTSKSRKTLSERDVYGKRIWEFSYAIKNGYNIFVRAKKTEKYAEIIKTFPAFLQEKIARGYGCDRKHGARCQMGCQGIGISLDDSILEIADDIKTWLDNEVK